jgi:tRNA uridine 5-carboxymethylaminomethyl modification enzyme
LLLRQDNADLRLSQIGYDVGLLPGRNFARFKAKNEAVETETKRLEETYYETCSLAKILARPEMSYEKLPNKCVHLPLEVIQQVEITIKYAGYVSRQKMEVARFKNLEDKSIPINFDYAAVPSLRLEARQKFDKIRPQTIGQAARISGVSPADISILLVWLKRGSSFQSQPDGDAGE